MLLIFVLHHQSDPLSRSDHSSTARSWTFPYPLPGAVQFSTVSALGRSHLFPGTPVKLYSLLVSQTAGSSHRSLGLEL